MGFINSRHGMKLLRTTPPGTCPEYAVKHTSEQPHNLNSLVYQYKFYNKYGRWPTWLDAMEHCSPDIKEIWIKELTACGVEIGGAK